MTSSYKVVSYSRVSTAHDQSPEAQVHELRRYCAVRDWALVEEIVDHGYSGGTDQRPGLKRLMALVRARKVDVVVVTKLDRFARSLKQLVSALDEFSGLGVLFVSIGDQIDLTTASGRLMLHLLAAFAEFERALIRERTMAGLAYARAQGKALGRPKSRDDRAIQELRSKGHSYSQIAKALGVTESAVYRSVKALAKSGEKPEPPANQKTETYND